MKPPYFQSPERQAALWRECQSWLGTPFRPRGCVKGRGVPCARFIPGVYFALGIVQAGALDFKDASPRRHEHRADSLIIDWFAQPENRKRCHRLDLEDSPPPAFMPGDILAIQTKKSVHHLALYAEHGLNKQLFHVDRHIGVTMVPLDRVQPYLKTAYRLLEA